MFIFHMAGGCLLAFVLFSLVSYTFSPFLLSCFLSFVLSLPGLRICSSFSSCLLVLVFAWSSYLFFFFVLSFGLVRDFWNSTPPLFPLVDVQGAFVENARKSDSLERVRVGVTVTVG